MITDTQLHEGYDEFRKMLERCFEREHNPFEPDNQSKTYYKLQALLNKYPKRHE